MENTKKEQPQQPLKTNEPSHTTPGSPIIEKTQVPTTKETNKERSFKEGLANNSDTDTNNPKV